MSYALLITIAFVTNGLSMVGLKIVSSLHLMAYMPVVLFCLYAARALGNLRVYRVQVRSILIGLIAGLSSVTGMACAAKAAALAPGFIVFPIISGGTLVLVAVFERVVFRERIGRWGVAGILVGLVAVSLLSW